MLLNKKTSHFLYGLMCVFCLLTVTTQLHAFGSIQSELSIDTFTQPINRFEIFPKLGSLPEFKPKAPRLVSGRKAVVIPEKCSQAEAGCSLSISLPSSWSPRCLGHDSCVQSSISNNEYHFPVKNTNFHLQVVDQTSAGAVRLVGISSYIAQKLKQLPQPAPFPLNVFNPDISPIPAINTHSSDTFYVPDTNLVYDIIPGIICDGQDIHIAFFERNKQYQQKIISQFKTQNVSLERELLILTKQCQRDLSLAIEDLTSTYRHQSYIPPGLEPARFEEAMSADSITLWVYQQQSDGFINLDIFTTDDAYDISATLGVEKKKLSFLELMEMFGYTGEGYGGPYGYDTPHNLRLNQLMKEWRKETEKNDEPVEGGGKPSEGGPEHTVTVSGDESSSEEESSDEEDIYRGSEDNEILQNTGSLNLQLSSQGPSAYSLMPTKQTPAELVESIYVELRDRTGKSTDLDTSDAHLKELVTPFAEEMGYTVKSFIDAQAEGVVFTVSKNGKDYALKLIPILSGKLSEYKTLYAAVDALNEVSENDRSAVIPIEEHKLVDFSDDPLVNGSEAIGFYIQVMPMAEKYTSEEQPVSTIFTQFKDLLGAILRLHKAGFAHLDIKPGNLMVLDGKWVLVDLGLNFHQFEYSTKPPLLNIKVGTLGYFDSVSLSNQMMGSSASAEPVNLLLADFQALAITLTELLLGEHPILSFAAMHSESDFENEIQAIQATVHTSASEARNLHLHYLFLERIKALKDDAAAQLQFINDLISSRSISTNINLSEEQNIFLAEQLVMPSSVGVKATVQSLSVRYFMYVANHTSLFLQVVPEPEPSYASPKLITRPDGQPFTSGSDSIEFKINPRALSQSTLNHIFNYTDQDDIETIERYLKVRCSKSDNKNYWISYSEKSSGDQPSFSIHIHNSKLTTGDATVLIQGLSCSPGQLEPYFQTLYFLKTRKDLANERHWRATAEAKALSFEVPILSSKGTVNADLSRYAKYYLTLEERWNGLQQLFVTVYHPAHRIGRIPNGVLHPGISIDIDGRASITMIDRSKQAGGQQDIVRLPTSHVGQEQNQFSSAAFAILNQPSRDPSNAVYARLRDLSKAGQDTELDQKSVVTDTFFKTLFDAPRWPKPRNVEGDKDYQTKFFEANSDYSGRYTQVGDQANHDSSTVFCPKCKDRKYVSQVMEFKHQADAGTEDVACDQCKQTLARNYYSCQRCLDSKTAVLLPDGRNGIGFELCRKCSTNPEPLSVICPNCQSSLSTAYSDFQDGFKISCDDCHKEIKNGDQRMRCETCYEPENRKLKEYYGYDLCKSCYEKKE